MFASKDGSGMQVTVNGETQELEQELTVAQLVESIQMNPQLVAVELNLTVLKRDRYAGTVLKEGDVVEVVHMVGGGC